MDPFRNRVAIVTGGASGIGRAIGEALIARGSRVVLADRNGELAAQSAAELGAGASAVTVDVTDADAVQRLVDGVVAEHGRLDLMFNNAGIAIIGDATDMALDDWTRTVDVNVLGVIHGLVAAYRVMVRQGSGHIINTASLAGLVPTPGFAAYAAAKHAVVGMSTSLHCEARAYGVKVSVVCPGLIDTPLKVNSEMRNLDREAAMRAVPARFTSAEICAQVVLRGIERDRAVIVVTGFAKWAAWLWRTFPRLYLWVGDRQMRKTRTTLRPHSS